MAEGTRGMQVWRTLHTEQARLHYHNKCIERKREALRDQRLQPRAKVRRRRALWAGGPRLCECREV